MPLLFSAFPWRLVAILGVAAGLAFGTMYIAGQLKKIGALQAQVTQVTAVANANAAEVKRLEAENKRVRQEAAKAAEAKTAIRNTGKTRRQAISVAPPTDDGPLAPVARRWISGLPEPAASGGASGATTSAKAP